MKSHSPELAALLNSGDDFQHTDIWTVILRGGVVVRWSGAEIPIDSGGQTFAVGPVLKRGTIREGKGLEVSSLSVSITADEDDLIQGIPVIEFIRRRGLDGAAIRLERAFMANWGDPVVGSVLRFAGKVTSIPDVSGNTAQVNVSSWTILLNTAQPVELYQTGCLNSLYGEGCGLDSASWAVTGAVASGPTTETQIATNLSNPAGWFSQGRLEIVSGPLAGTTRSVRQSLGDGRLVLSSPLPAILGVGTVIRALPGCDLLLGTCTTKFNNADNHRGYPFVPVPEMAV
jgi:uncharacterized phage protein (TIGR02218 family)